MGGRHPEGELRRRLDADLGPRRLRDAQVRRLQGRGDVPRRAPPRPLRALPAAQAQGRAARQGLDDPPDGSGGGSGPRADAGEGRPDARPARGPAVGPAALGLRGEVGRRARARLLRARPPAAGGAQRQRHHEALSRAAPPEPRAELAQRDPRRRDRRVRRRGPSELRPAPAPDAHRVRGPGEAALQGVAGRLRHLRPALARRALRHGPALHGPPRAPGAPGAEGVELAGARLRHRRRPRPAGGDPEAGPRGHRRQAAGQPLRAGAALDRLAQDQERPAHRRRRLRLDARGGAAEQLDRRAARRGARRRATCATRAGSAPASPTASSTASSSS